MKDLEEFFSIISTSRRVTASYSQPWIWGLGDDSGYCKQEGNIQPGDGADSSSVKNEKGADDQKTFLYVADQVKFRD